MNALEIAELAKQQNKIEADKKATLAAAREKSINIKKNELAVIMLKTFQLFDGKYGLQMGYGHAGGVFLHNERGSVVASAKLDLHRGSFTNNWAIFWQMGMDSSRGVFTIDSSEASFVEAFGKKMAYII